MLRGEALFLLVYRSGLPVAFANAHIQENQTLFKERIGFLDSMYIRPEARGKGLFSALLNRIEGWFRSKGVAEGQLGVAAANQHAKEIWAAKGYEPLMERRRQHLC
jgi:GNAT superfamily N-acetyltransferase